MMDYFYNTQAEQFASVEIPKEILTGENFSSLSASAKMLYAVLLDRMGEAKRHNWYDEENRVYVIYPLSKLEKDISFSRHTIIDCMNELEDFGLISRFQIKGKPSRIYVKNFNRRRIFQLIG